MSMTKGHINFALTSREIMLCAICGKLPSHWYSYSRVTTAGRNAIGGLVGICSSCGDGTKKHRAQLITEWRRAHVPRCIQLIRGKPIQLVVRGECDDEFLADMIRTTFEKVPEQSRRKIVNYVLSEDHESVTGKGMRFEALRHWPGMGDCFGMNMDRGHAIRLRAASVGQAQRGHPGELIEIIAHELAHTEQKAIKKRFPSTDAEERDVEERLRKWGFDVAMLDKEELLDEFDSLIDLAKKGKAAVRRAKTPSNNFSVSAIKLAEKARSCLYRAIDRWRGID